MKPSTRRWLGASILALSAVVFLLIFVFAEKEITRPGPPLSAAPGGAKTEIVIYKVVFPPWQTVSVLTVALVGLALLLIPSPRKPSP